MQRLKVLQFSGFFNAKAEMAVISKDSRHLRVTDACISRDFAQRLKSLLSFPGFYA